MSEIEFYDGTKLLSMKDINGLTPEIFISTSNRSAGKTTYFNRMAVNRFKKQGKKFCLLYRFNYELNGCSEQFFKDIGGLFFKGDVMTEVRRANGIYVELFLNKKPCGYCISINYADQIKKKSHLLSDVDAIYFDEFQSESNHYCDEEVSKFMSIHTSLARGGGQQVRYLPVYMISNAVSIINPYYLSLNIPDDFYYRNYLKRLDDNIRQDMNDVNTLYNMIKDDAQKYNSINSELGLISLGVGLGTELYNFSSQGRPIQTATGVMAKNSEAIRTIKKHEKVVKDAIIGFIKAVAYLSNNFTDDPFGEIETINVLFDDTFF
jgi:hypothetical protein